MYILNKYKHTRFSVRELFFIVYLSQFMRRVLFTYLLFLVIGQMAIRAQQITQYDQFGNQIDPSMIPENPDSLHTEVIGLPPTLYQWHISEKLGNRTIVPADTAFTYFQNTNLVEGIKGHYNYLGNLGSPRQSRIFFERPEATRSTLFLDPFRGFFYEDPEDFYFTNSNVPYTNLTYYRAGSKLYGEERFKSYFSVNVNKDFAFGFDIDYLYGRGYYNSQQTAFFKGGLFASYIGEQYQAHAIYKNFTMKMAENGGITDDRYITHPEDMAQGQREYETQNIPTNLDNTWNRNHNFYVYLTHRYNLGFHREIRKEPENENDSIPTWIEEFVPVTAFIHTAKIERLRHNFRSTSEPTDYYDETYIYTGERASRDSTTYISTTNTLGFSLLEGFNKYAQAGLTAYITHKGSQYELMNRDSVSVDRYVEQEVYVGGELSRRKGRVINYNATGEVGMLGKALGQFRIHGDMDLHFRLFKDTVNVHARASVTNLLPSFYMRHYHSNHFYWDYDFDKEFRTRVEGELNIARWRTHLKAGVENIKNYTYFNRSALPEQDGGSIQVITATFSQNFKLGVFHLDNEVIWQETSNKNILPLPRLSLYHNLYIDTKLAKKVLSLQLGADVRYFTSYYAPTYQPATQQFHLQPDKDRIEIGGYPVVNVYANLHLKRTRFFAMLYHANQGLGNNKYFFVPHYPLNQRLLKFGVSWNFYD